MMQAQPATVATLSADAEAMAKAWRLIDDILAGAAHIRSCGTRYLPKFEAEQPASYDRRIASAPWRPEFEDSLRGLCSKPFARPVTVTGTVSPKIKEFAENVDGRGADLNRFAAGVFRKAVSHGFTGIYVAFPKRPDGERTLGEEKARNPKPYWVHIPGDQIIACRTAIVAGREIFTHVRFWECTVVADGFGEKEVKRIRVLERTMLAEGVYGAPVSSLWEKREDQPPGVDPWEIIDTTVLSLPEIPFALFFTGEKTGTARCKPPLLDLANMQIELYRALSRKDEIETYAGSPMLCASGMRPPEPNAPQTVVVGPQTVLYAPGESGAGWSYVEPSAENLKELREAVASLIDDMRRLGMQPMTKKTGEVTATATSVETAKAHSALEAWAIGFKDALEQCLVFTSAWLNEKPTAEVHVFTDFHVLPADSAQLQTIEAARARKDISHKTYLAELRRRDILSEDVDVDKEVVAAAGEAEGLEPEEPEDPRTGLRLVGDIAA